MCLGFSGNDIPLHAPSIKLQVHYQCEKSLYESDVPLHAAMDRQGFEYKTYSFI